MRSRVDYIDRLETIIRDEYPSRPKANVLTFGCAQNENDSEKIRGLLVDIGYSMTDDLEDSDIVIFNTCAIRENAELKIFGNIGKLKAVKAQRPNMIIAVCGCMVMQEHIVEKLRKSYPFVDIVFGVNAIDTLPERIYRFFTERKRQISLPDFKVGINEELPSYRTSKVKASITIMYGCNNFCSYCIVPYVRGRENSRRPEDILKEFRELIEAGYKDITLLGQNVNSYGRGLEPKIDFADLLRLLCSVEGDYVINFMSSHPKDFTDKVIDVIRDNPRISRHIHLPVQSGNDRILHEMNRRYTVEDYMHIIDYARRQIPEVTFSSDIIVGFPGESFEEYLDTERLVKNVRFTQLFTYIYSKRNGTKAAQLKDDISHAEKARWLNRLIKVQQEITFDYLNNLVGTEQRVLIEEENDGWFVARNSNTVLVKFKADDDLLGSFVRVRIYERKGTTLYGERIKENG